MRVYRLVKKKYAHTSYDPTGAKLHGGRWNTKGTELVYTAGSESTAILEVAVHFNDSSILTAYMMASIELPEDQIMILEDEDLPDDWAEDPSPTTTAMIGDEWVTSGASLALSVPCSIAPGDRNYLINTDHDAFEATYKSLEVRPYPIDDRLNKK